MRIEDNKKRLDMQNITKKMKLKAISIGLFLHFIKRQIYFIMHLSLNIQKKNSM